MAEGWQTCPHCNGSGQAPGAIAPKPCPVCNGARIISTTTGEPPGGRPLGQRVH